MHGKPNLTSRSTWCANSTIVRLNGMFALATDRELFLSGLRSTVVAQMQNASDWPIMTFTISFENSAFDKELQFSFERHKP
jgi:hypothetical protein